MCFSILVMVLWFFFGIIIFIFFICISPFLFFVWFCASEGEDYFNFLFLFFCASRIFGVFFTFHISSILFHGISQCMLCFLSSVVEDEPHSTNAIFGWTFVDLVGFGIIFLSLKTNFVRPFYIRLCKFSWFRSCIFFIEGELYFAMPFFVNFCRFSWFKSCTFFIKNDLHCIMPFFWCIL
jgi:hypothetical protein